MTDEEKKPSQNTKTYLWKFNKESEKKPMQGDKWIITDVETLENTYTDYISVKAPLRTDGGDLGLGHGMIVTADLIEKEHPKVGKYIEMNARDDKDYEYPDNSRTIGIKLDIPNLSGVHDPKNRQYVPNMRWRIYEQVQNNQPFKDQYFGENIEYVAGIDIENVESWTGNKKFSIGWSLLTRGNVEYYTDEETGLRFARIFK